MLLRAGKPGWCVGPRRDANRGGGRSVVWPPCCLTPLNVVGRLANVKPPTTVVHAHSPTTIQEVDNPLADIDSVAEIADPAERAKEIGRRLEAIPAYQAKLRAMRQDAVLEMKGTRMSYAEIGRELGLHRNRIQQIAEGRSAGGQGGGAKAAT